MKRAKSRLAQPQMLSSSIFSDDDRAGRPGWMARGWKEESGGEAGEAGEASILGRPGLSCEAREAAEMRTLFYWEELIGTMVKRRLLCGTPQVACAGGDAWPVALR